MKATELAWMLERVREMVTAKELDWVRAQVREEWKGSEGRSVTGLAKRRESGKALPRAEESFHPASYCRSRCYSGEP